ncbi:MAG TPA: 6,7-dimethyl-8-ribityllumazine synthase [Thermoanaerobaculia bacterium]|nr:6,7-dimethyl-8-ribityllumazine synthase [Thermoanaerobaculia bacterium]
MSEIPEIAGALTGTFRRFGIVASRFNGHVVDALVTGAVDCLRRHGVADTDVRLVRVPGAWEIPAALAELAAVGTAADAGGKRLDGLVALGAVIRGETPHFDYICAECSRGIAEVSARYRIPVGFGLLTCATSAQAEARAGGKAGNKGWEAALAALEMADLFAKLRA